MGSARRVRVEDTPGRIELRVRLSDGSFDTCVELPVQASQEARHKVVAAWFDLITQALMMAGSIR